MNYLDDRGEIVSKVDLTQALRIWWATTWRYVVITFFVGIAFTLLRGLIGTFTGADPMSILQKSPTVASVVATVTSAVVMMFALRQALLANYHDFSLTILEEGSEEPGRIHRALGADRMVRIWWAAAWPLHLFGQGANYLALRFRWATEAERVDGLDALGCLGLVLLMALQLGLAVVCLWRAGRKQYRGFSVAVLKPWSAQ